MRESGRRTASPLQVFAVRDALSKPDMVWRGGGWNLIPRPLLYGALFAVEKGSLRVRAKALRRCIRLVPPL